MNRFVWPFCRFCALALAVWVPVLAEAAEPPRALAACQAIADSNQRLACYDSLLTPTPPPVPQAAPPTRSTIPAAVTSPATSTIPTQAPAVAPEPPTTAAQQQPAVVSTKEQGEAADSSPEKPSLFKRLLPFGWGDGKDAVEEEPTETTEMAESSTTELVATVNELVIYNVNTWQITLSNGQTWRQQVSKVFPLLEGDTVRLQPSRWGESYRLTADRINGFIQVNRVE